VLRTEQQDGGELLLVPEHVSAPSPKSAGYMVPSWETSSMPSASTRFTIIESSSMWATTRITGAAMSPEPRIPRPPDPRSVGVQELLEQVTIVERHGVAYPPSLAEHDQGSHARPVDDVDARLERTIGELLERRHPGATICPSEAARVVDPDGWRDLMPAARAAAGRLAAAGEVEVTQGGAVVDVASARGPVRVRRAR